jgi:hypothetical protein
LANKPRRHPVFDQMTNWTSLTLQHDLERCGIPYKDDDGRVADFHALRHTYITALGKAGLPIKVHQTLARHADPKLTLNVYSHLTLHDTAEAVESLPDLFTGPRRQAVVMTGTDPHPINENLAPLLPRDESADRFTESHDDAFSEKEILSIAGRNPLGATGEDHISRIESHRDAEKKDSSKNVPGSITDLVLLVYS